jgi:hypothetical protein
VRLTGRSLTVDRLDPGNGRCTIIVDSCRAPGAVAPRTLDYLTENSIIAARAPARPPRHEYRDAFNLAVARCPEQTIYLFGCSVGENARDDANEGGLFPEALLSRAIAWERERNTANATIRLNAVFYRAAIRTVDGSDGQQFPRIHPNIPAGSYFPFAVYRTV